MSVMVIGGPKSAVPAVAALLLACGCARQLNNPFSDSEAWARAELTTPSAEGFREDRAAVPQLRRRCRCRPSRRLRSLCGRRPAGDGSSEQQARADRWRPNKQSHFTFVTFLAALILRLMPRGPMHT